LIHQRIAAEGGSHGDTKVLFVVLLWAFLRRWRVLRLVPSPELGGLLSP